MDGLRRVLALAFVALLAVGACGDDSNSDQPAAGDDGCDKEAVTTDSGLKLENIECGDGEEVERGDNITVHYTGTLADGTEFDSSRGREPLPLQVGAGDVIQGFEDGIVGMRVGGIRKVTIPPELGYGAAGAPPAIPPNATLVFEIEVVEIK